MGTNPSSMTMAQVPVKSCDICEQSKGEDFCEDCQQMFCNNCKTLHLRSHISRNHTFTGNTLKQGNVRKKSQNENESRQTSSKKGKTVKCTVHKEELIFYCEDCEEAACKLCIFENHKGHDMSDIVKVVFNMTSSSSFHMEKVTREIENAHKNIRELQSHMRSFNSDIDRFSSEIKTTGDKVKDLVDKVVTLWISNLKSYQKRESVSSKINESINPSKREIDLKHKFLEWTKMLLLFRY